MRCHIGVGWRPSLKLWPLPFLSASLSSIHSMNLDWPPTCFIRFYYFWVFLNFFKNSLRFIAKLSRNYQDFSYIPCPHIYPCFLTIHILHQSDTCVTVSESRSPHHYHQSPWFTLGFTLAVAQSMGLDKYIMTCVLQDSIVQSSFTSLNILCALPTHPSLALNFWQPWIFFYCLHRFVFSRMSYGVGTK